MATDLNKMVREILEIIQEKNHWTSREAGRKTGLGRTYSRFMAGEQGLHLSSLGMVIENLGMCCLQFHSHHPISMKEITQRNQELERLYQLLTTEELTELVDNLSWLKKRGLLDSLRAYSNVIRDVAEASRSPKFGNWASRAREWDPAEAQELHSVRPRNSRH